MRLFCSDNLYLMHVSDDYESDRIESGGRVFLHVDLARFAWIYGRMQDAKRAVAHGKVDKQTMQSIMWVVDESLFYVSLSHGKEEVQNAIRRK